VARPGRSGAGAFNGILLSAGLAASLELKLPAASYPPEGGAQELMMRAASMAPSGKMAFNFMVLEKQHFASAPSNIKCIFSSI
jgi:hypothetical protein